MEEMHLCFVRGVHTRPVGSVWKGSNQDSLETKKEISWTSVLYLVKNKFVRSVRIFHVDSKMKSVTLVRTERSHLIEQWTNPSKCAKINDNCLQCLLNMLQCYDCINAMSEQLLFTWWRECSIHNSPASNWFDRWQNRDFLYIPLLKALPRIVLMDILFALLVLSQQKPGHYNLRLTEKTSDNQGKAARTHNINVEHSASLIIVGVVQSLP